ncbi:motility associated factor glycosyltransferase family protein [Paenibacillus bouchesdurhonensis]|uniref:motility associated factor glycosyltransferase family protein n=1 Tax=Paenibacillus bouchesdurhonensis TaxID=1870990 RepID=UPI000DA5F882|nr:6-hydroxymethylpterin diphosphokinase MptE-like protein [Paenibacillus bouchesdurhonensis]
MNILQTNLNFLRNQYPEVFEILDNADPTHTNEYISCTTKNNEPNLEIQVEGKSYFLHSKYNAKDEAKKWVRSIHHKMVGFKHLLIFGIGLGDFLEEILLTTDAKDIFIFEPDINIFRELIYRKDIRGLLSDRRIRMFAVGGDEIVQYQIAIFLAGYISGELISVSPLIYEKLFPQMIRSFDSIVKDVILKQISTFNTLKIYQNEWLLNILHNLPHVLMSTSMKKLKEVWQGQDATAIIVGSGPSLKEDVHYLKELRDKCLIIAAGSSIQAMNHYGIHPHFVVSLEGSHNYNKVFENVNVSRVPLVYCTQTYRKVVDSYQSDKFASKIMNDCITEYFVDKEIPSYFETPTVTGTAMQIADYMGVSKVILMGQDLSFPNDQYYAPGVNHLSEERKKSDLSVSDIKVKNVNGGENRTNRSMLVLQKGVEMTARVLKSRGIEVINTSKNGAALEGINWISMDALIEQLQKSPLREFNISRFADVQNKEELVSSLEKLNSRFQETQIALSKMDQHVVKIINSLEKLDEAVRKRNMNAVNKALLNVNKLWNWISRQDIFNVFYKFSLNNYINVYKRYIPEIMETKDTIEKSKLIITHLGALIRQINEFNPILTTSIESLQINLKDIIINKKFN